MQNQENLLITKLIKSLENNYDSLITLRAVLTSVNGQYRGSYMNATIDLINQRLQEITLDFERGA